MANLISLPDKYDPELASSGESTFVYVHKLSLFPANLFNATIQLSDATLSYATVYVMIRYDMLYDIVRISSECQIFVTIPK